MRADPDELLRGIRHLRKRAARGDLDWIRERYDAGKLRFLRKLMPDGGYRRLGQELSDDDVLGVRASLASIDDQLIAGPIELDEAARPAPVIDLAAEEHEPRPRLVSITADDSYRPDSSTSVFAPTDDYADQFFTDYDDEPAPFDDLAVDDDYGRASSFAYDDEPLLPDYDRDDQLVIVDDDYDAPRSTRVVEPIGRPRTTGRPPTRSAASRPIARRSGMSAGRATAPRPAPRLQWLFVALALVVLLSLYLTQCTGGDTPSVKTTSPSATTVAGAAGTTLPATPTTLAGVSPTVPPGAAPFTVFFASNSSTIDAVGQTVIAQALDRIRTTAPARLIISGYASPDGNPTANNELSIRRANAVADAITKGLGGSVPAITVDARVDANPDPDPARVRRVTITLSAI